MPLFSQEALSKVKNRDVIKQLQFKINTVKKAEPTIKKGNSISTRIQNICESVQSKLGHYADQLECIQDINRLHDYISASIEQGIIAIDTETTGLDPITDQIVGACIYTRNQKPAYIPINHISYMTNKRLNNQLTNEEVGKEFQRLVDNNVKCIFFNAKFDIRVMRHQLGVYIIPAWCGFIAGKCLKNNELEGNLKYLWKKYCCPPEYDEPALTFDKMFEGIKFNLIPIDTAYLYAAKDALMTLDMYDFQKPFLTEDDEKCIQCGFQKLAKLYNEIELPIIPIVADIEDAGVALDTEYAKSLSVKYNEKLKIAEENFHKELENYRDEINSYINTHPETRLEDPLNIGSPTQLAELFYDVLKVPPVSRKKPRGTGEDILEKMGHPLGKLILEYRGIAKLLNTYIEKMPAILNKKTGRIHCSFNQYGTDTGRFSSSDPNLQNIPSHNTDIRPMFIATNETFVNSNTSGIFELLRNDIVLTLNGEKKSQDLQIGDILLNNDKNLEIKEIKIDGKWIYIRVSPKGIYNLHVKRIYLMLGADYSQQEPKITAHLSNDEQFIAQCASGKDAYGILASLAFNRPYEECLEWVLDENGNPTHETNKEGKEIRSRAKKILLGICYGKTMKSIAEDLNVTEQKAQEIYDCVLTNISGLKWLMDYSQDFCRQYGYVETIWGRRRHIPDMMLPKFEIESKGSKNFDPFFDSKELGVIDDTDRLKMKYLEEMEKAKYKQQKENIKLKAEKDGFKIKENTMKIEDATRQVVNARVQGSAADQTKIAMRLIGNNQELKKLGFRMELLVHDEIIGECPFETALEVVPLFQKCMLNAAKDLKSGAKCDCSLTVRWYGKEYELEDLNDETLEKIKQEIYK